MQEGISVAAKNIALSNPVIFLLIVAVCTLYYIQMKIIRTYHKEKNDQIDKFSTIIENNTIALRSVLNFIESSSNEIYKESAVKIDTILDKVSRLK